MSGGSNIGRSKSLGQLFQGPGHRAPSFRAEKHLWRRSLRKQDLVLGGLIGCGSYGSVYKAKLRGIDAAVKYLHVNNEEGGRSEERENRARWESYLLDIKQHPHIAQFLGFCSESNCIVTEYLPNGSLWDVIDKPCYIAKSFVQRLQWLIDIAAAVNWLHNQRPEVIHCDLKLTNVFLDKHNGAKVGDFGLATILDVSDDSAALRCGPGQSHRNLLYQPPEVIRASLSKSLNRAYSKETDIWSFGVLIQELITLKPAYGIRGLNSMTIWVAVNDVRKGKLRPEIPEDRTTLPGKWHNSLEPLVMLMDECCSTDPSGRPSFAAIHRRLEEIKETYVNSIPPEEQASVHSTRARACSIGRGFRAVCVVLLLVVIGKRLWKRVILSSDAPSFTTCIETAAAVVLLLILLLSCCFPVCRRRNAMLDECHEDDASDQLISELELGSLRFPQDAVPIPSKPQSSPFAGAAGQATLSDTSISEHRARHYPPPENWGHVCQAFFQQLKPASQCPHVQFVLSYCMEHQSREVPNAEEWRTFLRNCLLSQEVLQTHAWKRYETSCSTPRLESISHIRPPDPDPFEAGPSIPINVPLPRQGGDFGCIPPGSSSRADHSAMLHEVAAVDETDDNRSPGLSTNLTAAGSQSPPTL